MIKTFPLMSLSISEATQLQFKLVDEITNEFEGKDILSLGDLGVVQPHNMPIFTRKVEKVIAKLFDSEDCILVRGSGTGAIRLALYSLVKKGSNILIHDAPIYPTTKTTLEYMDVNIIKVDFNNRDKLETVLTNNKIDIALVQHTRQKINDSYDFNEIVMLLHDKQINIVTDDNYAALKVHKIGCQSGATLSTFSSFKLLGPEGVGVIVGVREQIEKIRQLNYSGGSQVQGFEALEVLRGLTYAPVSLAISAEQSEELNDLLNNNVIEQIEESFIVNAQSKVVIAKLKEPIAKDIIKKCAKYGASPNPVGAESKYEITPMIYRVSSTFRDSIENSEDYLIRINPMRSSSKTIIKILKNALEE